MSMLSRVDFDTDSCQTLPVTNVYCKTDFAFLLSNNNGSENQKILLAYFSTFVKYKLTHGQHPLQISGVVLVVAKLSIQLNKTHLILLIYVQGEKVCCTFYFRMSDPQVEEVEWFIPFDFLA